MSPVLKARAGLQTLILVDRNNRVKGYAPYPLCHDGQGKMHRAFVTFIQTPRGIILQRRKHPLWNRCLDVSATSHCLRMDGRNETYREAGRRCVERELGITPEGLRNVGSYCYFARLGSRCENEHCTVLVGSSREVPEPNPACVYGISFHRVEELVHLSTRKTLTPWFRKALPFLLREYGEL